ncbi:hypothetical protein LMG33810_002837 [Carnimonas sp. LMG 33810]
MLGWKTARQMREMGYTHRVRMFGLVPAYAKGLDCVAPTIDHPHPLFAAIDYYIASPLYIAACRLSGREPHFSIQLIARIDQ